MSGWALIDRETEQVKARWQQDIIGSGGESMDERLRYIIENWHRVPRWIRYKILAKMWIALQRSRWERLGTSAIRHMVKGYYQQAGIVDKRKTTHSLRHSAISKVAKQNVMKARQVARHASIDTTMIYVHENDRLTDPGEQFIDYVNGNGG